MEKNHKLLANLIFNWILITQLHVFRSMLILIIIVSISTLHYSEKKNSNRIDFEHSNMKEFGHLL